MKVILSNFFLSGAMENWGLVTYREIYLLFNPATGTTRDYENIVTIIAHEFAVSIEIFTLIVVRF